MNILKSKYIYNKLRHDYLCKNPILILYNDGHSEGCDKYYTYEEYKQFNNSEIINRLKQKYFYDTNLPNLLVKIKNNKFNIIGWIICILLTILFGKPIFLN